MLFLTCSDPPINPNLLTQTEPGELFILRNAGNIVAPFDAVMDGEAATIEFAAALERIRPDTQVHVNFHELTYIDHACLDLLINWKLQHKAAGGELVIDWDRLRSVFQRHAWGERRIEAA